MRIAFITQDFPPDTGGIQTYSFEIAKYLSGLCEKFVLIVPAKKNQDAIDRQVPFEVIRIPTSNTLLGVALLPRLKKIIQKYKLEHTFHAQWQTALPAIRLKQKGLLKKVSIAAHGRELLFNPFLKVPVLGTAYTKYQASILKRVDELFPVSTFTANLLQQQAVDTQKIKVIHNGTNYERFTPASASSLKKRLGLEHKKILFTICRHVERKGIQDVLSALPAALAKIPELHYVIAGSGDFQDKLKEQTKHLRLEKQVTFTGRIAEAELNDYYNLCDVFIMTPREIVPDVEGFGIVYLEANACEKPVIGTVSGGVTDAIQDGGTGLLIERESPKAISDAIIKLMVEEGEARRLGRQGREWVAAVMNWEVVSQKLYQSLNTL